MEVKPLIVNFVPTGAVPDRTMHPGVPLSPEEIAAEVDVAVELGITMVHLHARDDAGRPTLSPQRYAEIIGKIRQRHAELVICVSLSGRYGESLEERLAPLDLKGELKPDMASLTLSSLNFARSASVNEPAVVEALAQRMLERGVLPELEIFDLGMANVAKYLVHKGKLKGPHYANVLLGNIAGAQADALQTGLLLQNLPEDTYWALGGIGAAQLTANALGIALHGGVRVGLEDNLYWDSARSRLAVNGELLERVHQLAALHDRRVMSAGEFRERMGLLPGKGRYGKADIKE